MASRRKPSTPLSIASSEQNFTLSPFSAFACSFSSSYPDLRSAAFSFSSHSLSAIASFYWMACISLRSISASLFLARSAFLSFSRPKHLSEHCVSSYLSRSSSEAAGGYSPLSTFCQILWRRDSISVLSPLCFSSSVVLWQKLLERVSRCFSWLMISAYSSLQVRSRGKGAFSCFSCLSSFTSFSTNLAVLSVIDSSSPTASFLFSSFFPFCCWPSWRCRLKASLEKPYAFSLGWKFFFFSLSIICSLKSQVFGWQLRKRLFLSSSSWLPIFSFSVSLFCSASAFRCRLWQYRDFSCSVSRLIPLGWQLDKRRGDFSQASIITLSTLKTGGSSRLEMTFSAVADLIPKCGGILNQMVQATTNR